MVEGGGGEDVEGFFKNELGLGGVAFCGDEFCGVVGGEVGEEEKVGGGGGFAEEADALADERSDGGEFFRGRVEVGLHEEGRELSGEVVDGEGAEVLAVEPDCFVVEGRASVKLMTALARLTFSRVKSEVSSAMVRNSRSFFWDQPRRQRKLMKALGRKPASR